MIEAKRRVLNALNEGTRPGPDYRCVPFSHLVIETRLDRRTVRRHCRALAREGLAEFHSGLWTDDGETAGSGYCISVAGREHLKPAKPPTPECDWGDCDAAATGSRWDGGLRMYLAVCDACAAKS